MLNIILYNVYWNLCPAVSNNISYWHNKFYDILIDICDF